MQHPTLSHSQNFLRHSSLARRLVHIARIDPEDTVVEIGAGTGMLTQPLAMACRRVIAVEADPVLASRLRDKFRDAPAVAIREADFLDVRLPRQRYSIFGSLPFNQTSAIMEHILEGPTPPQDAWLVMQKEAALRYAGPPYARESLSSLLLKVRFQIRVVHEFARTDFEPAPSVDAVMVHLRLRARAPLGAQAYREFASFMRFVHAQPGHSVQQQVGALLSRKQIGRAWKDAAIAGSAQFADLRLGQWLAVYACYAERALPAVRRQVRRWDRSRSLRRRRLPKR